MNTKSTIRLALAGIAGCLIGVAAQAAPIHATFSGAVTGSTGAFTQILNDVPAGTAASFDVTFDDSGLLPFAPLSDLDLAPVSGWLRLGSQQWSLDAGSIWSYTYHNVGADFPILHYGLQLTGTGPAIGSGSLFGLFLKLKPDLTLAADGIYAGAGYPTGGGTYYSYADLGGSFSASRVTPVPEPGTLLLLSSGMLLVWGARRQRSRRDPLLALRSGC
jgi:hypothetical protein